MRVTKHLTPSGMTISRQSDSVISISACSAAFRAKRFFASMPVFRFDALSPPACPAWGGVELIPVLHSIRTASASRESRLRRSPLHGETPRRYRALAGDGAVLTLPPPIPVQRFRGSTRPTTRWCRVRTTHHETVIPSDLRSPRSLQLARKSRRR